MPLDDSLADRAEDEIGTLLKHGHANGWTPGDIQMLMKCFSKWMQHPHFLDHTDLLRTRVLNELTFLLSEPPVGDPVWEFIRTLAKRVAAVDPHGLRASLRVATFELAAEPPEYPPFLKRLFSLAADEDTRWAVFAGYEKFPWRLRPHAHKYSVGMISDEDCDQWLTEEGWADDEILMRKQL